MKNKTLEQEINEFLQVWDCDQMCSFLDDITPLFELYDVEENHDWLKDKVGEIDERNVRLIRTVYLVSRIAEIHSGKMALIRGKFKDIYKRLEKHGTIEVMNG